MSDAKVFTTVFTGIFIASDVNSNRKLRVFVFRKLRNFLNLKLCAGPNGHVVYIALKIRQFQNEFMKSLFLPKFKRKIVRILPCVVRAKILTIFCSYFGRNND